MNNENIVETIYKRHSIRRYNPNLLPNEELKKITGIIAGSKALIHTNRFEVLLKNRDGGDNLSTVLAAYGKIMSPPHILVPYGIGDTFLTTDLGFRVQQIVVHMWQQEIGSCYIGCLSREEKVKEYFQLPENCHIVAILVFGKPNTGLDGYLLNKVVRKTYGGNRRKPINTIFFKNSFENPCIPPEELSEIIEAGRCAPSAVNAQPWRFLYNNDRLFVFIEKPGGLVKNTRIGYAFHDAGISMANISLALSQFGFLSNWTVVENDDPGFSFPDNMLPVAYISLKGF